MGLQDRFRKSNRKHRQIGRKTVVGYERRRCSLSVVDDELELGSVGDSFGVQEHVVGKFVVGHEQFVVECGQAVVEHEQFVDKWSVVDDKLAAEVGKLVAAVVDRLLVEGGIAVESGMFSVDKPAVGMLQVQ